jgi:mannose-1-phosphate guanylyltransferase
MYSVVMAGGSGTRFWPESRQKRPKQLLALTGEQSLLQQTVGRMEPLTPADKVLIVTGESHAEAVKSQLDQLSPGQVLAEPMGRNTAAAAGVAAAWVAKKDPGAVCLVLPADHLVTGEKLYMDVMNKAASTAAKQDVLVTLGLTPRYAATGFGYIEVGQVEDEAAPQVCHVKAFHEKPQLDIAQKYLESGRHFWNSGMFAWRAEVLLDEIKTHLPKLHAGIMELAPSLGTDNEDAAMAEIYPELPAISVDHGILEKTGNLRVVKADFGWSDVGSWDAMSDLWPADEQGNVARCEKLLAIESRDNVVMARNRLVSLLGVEGLVTVVTDDVLLVMPKERCQDIKQVITRLKEGGLDDYL